MANSQKASAKTLPRLYVVSGPTAVGKGTVVRQLRAAHSDLPLSVSVTTRAPRDGEVDGVDYHFVSDEQFDDLVREDALLEWATVHQLNRYGTPRAWVEEQTDMERPVLLELDLEGARQVKQRMPDAVTVFIMPPSWEELEKRLQGRGTEDSEERARRLRTAKVEMAAQKEFDVILVNDDVDRTASDLAAVLGLD